MHDSPKDRLKKIKKGKSLIGKDNRLCSLESTQDFKVKNGIQNILW